MSYYRNYSKMSLLGLKEELMKKELIKSRQLLKDEIEISFSRLMKANLNSTEDLMNAIKSKSKALSFASEWDVSEDYIILLRRELNSMKPKPNNIVDFKLISDSTKRMLQNHGVTNTLQLYNSLDKGQIETSERLLSIANLSRIRYANHTFVEILIAIGYNTVEQIAMCDYMKLHREIKQYNTKYQLYKAKIGLNDVKLFVNEAKLLKN